MSWIFLILLMLIEFSISLAPNEIIILILSQPDEYFSQLANNLRSDIYNQSILISKNDLINIHLVHEIYNYPGDWTFLAMLPHLTTTNLIKPNTKWIILCEDQSNLNLKILLNQLNNTDHTKEIYLGHSLFDRDSTIIHHFAFFENPQWFPYPFIRAGVAFTIPFITRLTKRVLDEKPTTDFFIDASHELSLFIWQTMKIENNKENSSKISNLIKVSNEQTNHLHGNSVLERQTKIIPKNAYSKSNPWSVKIDKLYMDMDKKIRLTNAPYFCSENGYGCAIYPKVTNTKTCKPVKAESIYFAIKTCKKFHNERIPTIETTWGRYTVHKRYFSDINDKYIPTISTGVPNTETGHCAKTLSILKIVLNDIDNINEISRNEINKIKWIFLSDDDTLLSVSAVCDILGCFNADKNIYLGERYGYRLHSKDGFNYITGGGGIVFSLSTTKKIINSCTCPTISSPDDMIIGSCLQELGVKAIHSSKFHQARPSDYSYKLLSIEKPLSFHKFWQIDPNYLYKKWFENSDKKMLLIKLKLNKNNKNCRYLNTNYNINSASSTKNMKILKNIGKHHNINRSRRKLQEHSEYHTTFKTKLQHIDL